jgi:hypothetical protein
MKRMNRTDCAIVVNTTPKYFYILETFFGLLRRYACGLAFPVYLATEAYDDPKLQILCGRYNVQILQLADHEADFLESRAAAIKALPPSIRYVLPVQEDFLLERPGPDMDALKEALEILDTDPQVLSLRLMPCPGSTTKECYKGVWNKLVDRDMIFSYQATIWRREVYRTYMAHLAQQGHEQHPDLSGAAWNRYCVNVNPAETHTGFFLLRSLYPTGVHLCYPRLGAFANAVYLCPFPYRPTAIVQGILQPWAIELATREGFVLAAGPSLR